MPFAGPASVCEIYEQFKNQPPVHILVREYLGYKKPSGEQVGPAREKNAKISKFAEQTLDRMPAHLRDFMSKLQQMPEPKHVM